MNNWQILQAYFIIISSAYYIDLYLQYQISGFIAFIQFLCFDNVLKTECLWTFTLVLIMFFITASKFKYFPVSF